MRLRMRRKFDYEVNTLANRDGFKCQRCGTIFGDLDIYLTGASRLEYGIHVDHILPVCLRWIFPKLRWCLEKIENKRLLCVGCNIKKGKREDKPLCNKYNMIYICFLDVKDIKSVEGKELYWQSLMESTQESLVNRIRDNGLKKEDFVQYLAYKAGRIEVTIEDMDTIDDLGDFINFDFRRI